VEEGTREVHPVAGALAIMPDPVAIKKRTGFGPHFRPGLGPESSILDSAAECMEANNSKAPTAVSSSFHSKKRTGFGPQSPPGLGPESSVPDSAAECDRSQQQQWSSRGQHFFPLQKADRFWSAPMSSNTWISQGVLGVCQEF
jgi:hypothetical protein